MQRWWPFLLKHFKKSLIMKQIRPKFVFVKWHWSRSPLIHLTLCCHAFKNKCTYTVWYSYYWYLSWLCIGCRVNVFTMWLGSCTAEKGHFVQNTQLKDAHIIDCREQNEQAISSFTEEQPLNLIHPCVLSFI